MMVVDMLIEGVTDQAAAQKIIQYCGYEPGVCYGKRGINYIRQKASGFNVQASHGNPILALVDFMDTRIDCAPAVIQHWLSNRSDKFLLRVVVPELESWLMADREAIARYLGISVQLIPRQPEGLDDPKQSLVNLARRSRYRRRSAAMVPAHGISASVGPGYAAAIEEYILSYWRIDVARQHAPSLNRCINRLDQLSNTSSIS